MSNYLRYAIIVLVAIMLISIFFVMLHQHSNTNRRSEGPGKLYINDKIINAVPVSFTKDHVTIPLIQLLSELGYSVEWRNSYSVSIKSNSSVFTLDLPNKSLVSDDSEINILHPGYGASSWYCEAIASDILLDYVTFKNVLFIMGQQLFIYPNYETLELIIETA